MKIYDVTDREFASYGQVLEGYDYSELFAALEQTIQIPEEGFGYVASIEALENLKIAQEFSLRGFGGMPIQLGSVYGKNRTLNCLEYHKSSEFNIAQQEVVLLLGKQGDLVDHRLNTETVKAFRIPAGCGVELFATTLHYAPCNAEACGYRVVCVLPSGTNAPRPEGLTNTGEDRLCMGTNKWLLAHADAPEIKGGAFEGLIGENITIAI